MANPSQLLDELNEAVKSQHRKTGFKCAVGKFLATLPESERNAIEKTIENPDVVLTRLHPVLAKHGLDVGITQLQRHRKRLTGSGCACPKR